MAIHEMVANYLRLGDELIDAQLWADIDHLLARMRESTEQLADAAFYCQVQHEQRDR